LSKSLEQTAREFYQQARETLKEEAAAGHLSPVRYRAIEKERWPGPVREFSETTESERFALSGTSGDHLDYLLRHGDDVWVYSRNLGSLRMQELTEQIRRARETVAAAQGRDLRHGLIVTLIILIVAVWVVALISLIYLAHRISRPIQQLTGGL